MGVLMRRDHRRGASAPFFGAGAVLGRRAGCFMLPSDLAAMRAGVAVDLDKARAARLAGDKVEARHQLRIARHARILVSMGQSCWDARLRGM